MQILDAGKTFFPIKWKVLATNLSSWGGVLENLSVQGTWWPEEWKLPINILELQFGCLSCTGLCTFKVSL